MSQARTPLDKRQCGAGLTAAGYSIPADQAVIGFDDVQAASYSDPRLSSVNNRSRTSAPPPRWRHPSRGLPTPDRFLAVAEEADLIQPIGLWVLSESCRQLATWPGTHLAIGRRHDRVPHRRLTFDH